MKTWIKIMVELYLLLIIIIGSFFIGAISGSDLQQKMIESTLKKSFEEKNLTFIDEKKFLLNTYYSEEDFETYNNYFQSQYNYSKDGWNCQSSSLNWAGYLTNHNIDYKYFYTDNHIFVIAYNDIGWCILDGNYITCYGGKVLN